MASPKVIQVQSTNSLPAWATIAQFVAALVNQELPLVIQLIDASGAVHGTVSTPVQPQ